LNVDPLVDATGQAYAYTGDDPVNGSDPSGLDSVYVLYNQDGVPYYVGRSMNDPEVERKQAHQRSGRMGPNDQMLVLNTVDLNLCQARDVEEYVMSRLGTMAGRGSFPMNQRHEVSPANKVNYYAQMMVAIETMSVGEPGVGPSFDQLNALKVALDSAAQSNAQYVAQYLRAQLWSPYGPATAPGGAPG
jgi:hypothetical protein